VATVLLVAGSTLTFWIPWQTPFASTNSYSSIVQSTRLLECKEKQNGKPHSNPSFKAPGCCKRITYGLFQLTHMSHDDHTVRLIKFRQARQGGQNEDKTLLQRSHKGEFQHVSISGRQRSLRCGQNLPCFFLGSTLLMTVGSCAWAMADKGVTKGLLTPPPLWVSAQLLYVCVTAWQRSRGCSRSLCSPFLRAVRLFALD